MTLIYQALLVDIKSIMSAIVSPLKEAQQAAATAIQTTGAADRSSWLCNFVVQVVALCQLSLCSLLPLLPDVASCHTTAVIRQLSVWCAAVSAAAAAAAAGGGVKPSPVWFWISPGTPRVESSADRQSALPTHCWGATRPSSSSSSSTIIVAAATALTVMSYTSNTVADQASSTVAESTDIRMLCQDR